MKTKKLGRPKVAKDKYKGVIIGARFTPDEAAEVRAAVKRSGLIKSEWIRNTLLGAASRGSV